jgi:Icc protein
LPLGRRDFILLSTATWAVQQEAATKPLVDFSFIHFTETHITDQLHADEGCRMCFRKINRLGADFAIAGGDLVYDVCGQGWKRASQLYQLYKETVKVLNIPVYHAIGNHDVYGLFATSGVSTKDQYFGKQLFQELIGRRYYSFQRQGWHFLVLDSIGIGDNRQYTGIVDLAQIEWLKTELAAIGTTAPIVVVTHIPLVTAYLQYGSLNKILPPNALVVANSRQVMEILDRYNVKAVLQGHLHVREIVDNGKGCRFITSGAVCGNWWLGPRDGHPEGFSRFVVRANQITWQYLTYDLPAAEHNGNAAPDIVTPPASVPN